MPSGLTGSGTTWTATVATGGTAGTLRLDLIDDDSVRDGENDPLGGAGVGNGNFTSGEVYTIDQIRPTVTLSSSASDPTNVAPIPVSVTFSEIVTGFTAADDAVRHPAQHAARDDRAGQ